MVLAQWFERGFGQWIAPDDNYEAQPDVMDTRSELWQMIAPDPRFSVTQASPPPRAFRNKPNTPNPTTTTTTTTPPGEPVKIFLSPIPKKRRPLKHAQTVDGKSTTELEEQILIAAHDTYRMAQYNSKFRDQTKKMFAFCCSESKLPPKTLESVENLLKINKARAKATDGQEPSLLTQARTFRLGALCDDGYTPFMAAAKSNQVPIAQLMFQYASEQEKNLMLVQTSFYGQTAFHIAAHYGQTDFIEFLQKVRQELLPSRHPSSSAASAHVDTADSNGMSAWETAMISTIPKAKKNRSRMGQLLSPSPDKSPTNLRGSIYVDSLGLQYTTAHLNGQRILNEDAILCQFLPFCKGMLFLVCDGHADNGSVADFIARRLPPTLETVAASLPDHSNNTDEFWVQLCQMAAQKIEKELKTAYLAGGSTACWVIVTDNQIICANVGDSRCLLLQNTPQEGGQEDNKRGILPLSIDHKPDLPEEQARIEEAGLTVVHRTFQEENVQQSIAKVQLSETSELGTSRAFGDFEYKEKDAVICTPDVQIVQRHSSDEHRPEYLILACDGIWDVLTNEVVAEFVRESQNDLAATAELLLKKSLGLGSGDNLSLVLVSFGDFTKQPNEIDPLLSPRFHNLSLQEERDYDDDAPPLPEVKAYAFSPEKKTMFR